MRVLLNLPTPLLFHFGKRHVLGELEEISIKALPAAIAVVKLILKVAGTGVGFSFSYRCNPS